MINDDNKQINLENADINDGLEEKNESSKIIFKKDESIDVKNDLVIQLENKINVLKEQERDIVLRFTAEIENIRKRSRQELEKAYKYSLERFVFELLPVIDNLERTLSTMDHSNTSLFAFIKGIELTLKSFIDTIRKFGVESIHDVKVPFNPEVHQAISTMESEEDEPNKVLTIIQKGYILNGRLIRPAMVIVSKSKT